MKKNQTIFKDKLSSYYESFAESVSMSRSTIMSLVAKKTNRYPSAGNIILVSSTIDYLESDYTDDEMTFIDLDEDGEHASYLLLVTDIESTSRSVTIICETESGHRFEFDDSNVVVVDLYVIPSQALDHSFSDEFDAAADDLSVSIDRLGLREELYASIGSLENIFFDKIAIVLNTEMLSIMRDVYIDRELLDKTASEEYTLDSEIINIRLENTLLHTDSLENGFKDYAVEYVNALHELGFMIVLSSTLDESLYDDVIEAATDVGLKFDSYNFNLQAALYKHGRSNKLIISDWVIDNRAMITKNADKQAWDSYFEAITGKKMSEIFNEQDASQQIAQLCLDMPRETFDDLTSTGVFAALYPGVPDDYQEMKEYAYNKINNKC